MWNFTMRAIGALKIGSVWFAHPLTFSSGNLKTAEKALDYFLKNDLGRVTAIVLGHTHKSGDIRKGAYTSV